MHRVEDNLDAQRYECADGRGSDEPERKFDVLFRRAGQVPDANNVGDNKREADRHAVIGEAAEQKERKKEAATDPQEVRFRSGGEQTGADRDEECSNQKRPDHEDRRTCGRDEILARKKESGQRTDVPSGNAEGDDQDHGQGGRDDHARHECPTAGIGREFLFQEIGKPIGEAFGMWDTNRLGDHLYVLGS